ncbi:hypothetical protein F2P45_17050 [Massilia sp. CCM 8733]|uniref:Transmembrane protein n=1 Tax=Massilia mucilaginosa TaxID=2609282 RepID=A0ABX0NVE0_9BURK|nr:hypothetical protein [Massilia mucilaginosa]NHZ90716.1 hypothetical protein [Massilia mucilaginosa]
MDLSPVIATIVPLAGLVPAFMVGRRTGRSNFPAIWFFAILLALGIGVALTIVQVFVHTLCTEESSLCTQRGDVNMTYWFQSFFAIPLFWLIVTVSGYRSRRAKQKAMPRAKVVYW